MTSAVGKIVEFQHSMPSELAIALKKGGLSANPVRYFLRNYRDRIFSNGLKLTGTIPKTKHDIARWSVVDIQKTSVSSHPPHTSDLRGDRGGDSYRSASEDVNICIGGGRTDHPHPPIKPHDDGGSSSIAVNLGHDGVVQRLEAGKPEFAQESITNCHEESNNTTKPEVNTSKLAPEDNSIEAALQQAGLAQAEGEEMFKTPTSKVRWAEEGDKDKDVGKNESPTKEVDSELPSPVNKKRTCIVCGQVSEHDLIIRYLDGYMCAKCHREGKTLPSRRRNDVFR